LANAGEGSALSDFERMEEKVNEEEARAKAYAELDQDTLDERFKAMEEEDAINQELAALKSRVGSGSA
jgi:phage shock protein A